MTGHNQELQMARQKGHGHVSLHTLSKYESARQLNLHVEHRDWGTFALVPLMGSKEPRWALPGGTSATREQIARMVDQRVILSVRERR